MTAPPHRGVTGAMKDLLEEVGLTPREIERVVVDRGPGLFTGLRVGIATAIAFSQALGCELVGVTSLEMLAGGAFSSGVRGTLVACVDGRTRVSRNLSSSTVTSSPSTKPVSAPLARSWRIGKERARRSPSPAMAWSATAVIRAHRDNLRPGRAVVHAGLVLGASRSPRGRRVSAVPARSRRGRQLHDSWAPMKIEWKIRLAERRDIGNFW